MKKSKESLRSFLRVCQTLSVIVFAALSVQRLSAQNIAWSAAAGITGDANVSNAGIYFDAFLPNSGDSAPVTVNGTVFHVTTSASSSLVSDGKISYAGTGFNNYSWAGSFPISASASASFAALMDDGGIFQNGGAGTGAITLAGLTSGHSYAVQIFNYAPDGDAGLTGFSGVPVVVLSNSPGSGVNGEFATGTFLASGTTESFSWHGSNSSYTVVGPISVRDVTAVLGIAPTNVVNQGDMATVFVTTGIQSAGILGYQWNTDNGSSGASWSSIPDATGSNYVVNTGSLAVGDYQYEVVITNGAETITSSPVTLTVIAPSAPVVLQNTTPGSFSPYVGQNAAFAAAFTGNLPITNQWQVSLNGGQSFQDLAGMTNTTMSLTDVQLANSGEYRLAATNAYGSSASTPASLSVKPWSDAHIQWSPPMAFLGMTAGQILTNVSGSYVEAAAFFFDSCPVVFAGNEQFTFRSDASSVSLVLPPYYANIFETNAIYGSGALGTHTTADTNFDFALNQYYDGGGSNLISLHNLIIGQQYSVQLFGLDNRGGGDSADQVDYADANDAADSSAPYLMGNNVYLLGTFTATNKNQTIQENLLDNGFGNINAVVVRALSYTPAVAPSIVTQPRQRTAIASRTATFTVIADGAPAPAYQWQAGPVGGPYTNLAEGVSYSGTTTPALSIPNATTNDLAEYVVAVTNTAGGLASAPVDLAVQAVGQPLPSARPIRITCVGASDVSTPTPYGTPNWPVYIAPMLGYQYLIDNCGASGTTMTKQGDSPYWNTAQYTEALASSPDIVIIMLGSNDSKPYNWIYQTNYVPDYEDLIHLFQNLPSHPRVYVNTLLTVYGPGSYDITDPIVTGQLCPIIHQISFDEQLPLIDVNAATKGMPQNFPDNVHPDIAGAHVVAQTVFAGLMNSGETPPPVDQVLNKLAVASSVSGGNVAANAVDADYTTMWSSVASDPQWIYVDLGSPMNINGVYLNWGANYGSSYLIQVSYDATNWTGIYTNTAGAGGIDRIGVAASGRYVRMFGVKSAAGDGYSLLDFTVTAVPTSPTLTVTASTYGLSFSWPTSSIPFQLESTASLIPPVAWTSFANNTLTISNGFNYVSLVSTGSDGFFRLQQQP